MGIQNKINIKHIVTHGHLTNPILPFQQHNHGDYVFPVIHQI